MNRYAIIETGTGFVWGVVNAESALAACTAVDDQAGGHRQGPGAYEDVGAGELRTIRSAYDVRHAPADFSVRDGQNASDIAAVDALPRAGVFRWIGAD